MGKRYEKSKKNVGENIADRQRIENEKKAIEQEISFLASVENLMVNLEDETMEAVENVKTKVVNEEIRLQEEHQTNSREREAIEQTINNEITKLQNGAKKLEGLEEYSFGMESKRLAKQEYKVQIDRFNSLIEELEGTTTQEGHADISLDINSSQTIDSFERDSYLDDVLGRLEEGLQDTFDKEMVMAGAQVRKLREPNAQTSKGSVKGEWKDSVFYMDDDFVPPYKNEKKLTVAEIRKDLRDSYGIEFDGIPYINGIADFSSIAIASISTKEIVMAARGITSEEYDNLSPSDRTSIFSEVFKPDRRNSNFIIADQIIADRQIPVSGLEAGYSAKELSEWRKNAEHRFTWDEQVGGGYNLVPTVIHGNLQHTGLVSSATRALEYFEEREQANPGQYSWDENDAPISIKEFLDRYQNS